LYRCFSSCDDPENRAAEYIQKQKGSGKVSGASGKVASGDPDHLLWLVFLSNIDHFHFRIGDIPLSNLVRRLQTGYIIGACCGGEGD